MSSNLSPPPPSSPSVSTVIKPSKSGCLILIGVILATGFLVYVIFWGLMNAPAGSNQTLNTGIYQSTPKSSPPLPTSPKVQTKKENP